MHKIGPRNCDGGSASGDADAGGRGGAGDCGDRQDAGRTSRTIESVRARCACDGSIIAAAGYKHPADNGQAYKKILEFHFYLP